MDHSSLTVTPVEREREREFQQLMQKHHYLGALCKIGNTIRYVAAVDGQWLGVLSFSAPALKCAARDEWIGWSRAHPMAFVLKNSEHVVGCDLQVIDVNHVYLPIKIVIKLQISAFFLSLHHSVSCRQWTVQSAVVLKFPSPLSLRDGA